MTDDTPEDTSRQEAFDVFAQLVQLAVDDEDGPDLIDIMHAARTLMTPALFEDFALQWDVCPVHVCDIEICADDDVRECARFWERDNA